MLCGGQRGHLEPGTFLFKLGSPTVSFKVWVADPCIVGLVPLCKAANAQSLEPQGSALPSLTVESVVFFRILQPRQKNFWLISLYVLSGSDWRIWNEVISSASLAAESLFIAVIIVAGGSFKGAIQTL